MPIKVIQNVSKLIYLGNEQTKVIFFSPKPLNSACFIKKNLSPLVHLLFDKSMTFALNADVQIMFVMNIYIMFNSMNIEVCCIHLQAWWTSCCESWRCPEPYVPLQLYVKKQNNVLIHWGWQRNWNVLRTSFFLPI